MRCITHLDTFSSSLWSLDLFSFFSSRQSKSRWWWSLLGRYFVIWITSCFLTMKKTTKNAVGAENKQKNQEPRSAVAASHHKRREEFISSSRGRYLSSQVPRHGRRASNACSTRRSTNSCTLFEESPFRVLLRHLRRSAHENSRGWGEEEEDEQARRSV